MHSFIERSLVGLVYAAVWVTSLVYSPNLGYPILIFVIAFVAAFEMLKFYQIRSLALTTLLCLGTASLLVFNVPLLQIAIISFVCQMGLAILLFSRKSIQAHPPTGQSIMHCTFAVSAVGDKRSLYCGVACFHNRAHFWTFIFYLGSRCNGLQLWNSFWKNTTFSSCVAKKID